MLSVSLEKHSKMSQYKEIMTPFYVLILFKFVKLQRGYNSLTEFFFFFLSRHQVRQEEQVGFLIPSTYLSKLKHMAIHFHPLFFQIAFLFVSSPFPLMAMLIVALPSAHAEKGMMTPVKSDIRPDKPVWSRRQRQQTGEDRVGSRGGLAEA